VSGDPRDTVSSFLHMGSWCAGRIVETLRKNGTDIQRLRAILDFGCGCGRTIRHFRSLTPAELYGSDCNPAQIDWCRRHLVFGRFDVNQVAPPLSYADGRFDLVYAFSVFTHLSPALQIAWIRELWRVLEPRGHLAFSVHGESELRRNPRFRDLAEAGMLVSDNDDAAGTNGCNAYHTLKSVQGHLTDGFELVEYIPADDGQDFYLFRKPSAR
jgi:SAM-dependent methyltransferase